MSVFSQRRFSVLRAVFVALPLLCVFPSYAETGALLGFEFGLSSKNAFKKAAENGLETLEKGKNKNGRRVAVFKGAATGVPVSDGEKAKTRVTFFRDRVETVTLLLSTASERDALAVERFVSEKYGLPSANEEVLSYIVKSWNPPESRVALSYSRGGVLKLAHTHLPTRKDRYERKLRRDKIKDKRSPARRMIDGDFSKPDYKR